MLTYFKTFCFVSILYLVSIYIFYRTPVYFGQLFFGLLLGCLYLSKSTLNWYFYFLLLFNSPGYLFSTADTAYRPIYYLHPIFNLPLLVFLIFSFKYSKSHQKITIPKFQVLYFGFSIFLIFVSLLFKFKLDNLFVSLIGVLQISFIWILPTFYCNYDKIKSFLFLFLFTSLPILITQLIYIKSGIHLFELVGGDVFNSNFSNSIEISSGSGRPLYSMQISCINLIGFFFISVFDKEFALKTIEKFLLKVFASISFLCLFVSATRGYIIFGIIIILGVFFNRNQKSAFNRIAFGLIFFAAFYFFSQYFNLDFILSRSLTIFDFADGDVTADGTNARLTERAPLVYEKFFKSVLFGLGFSEESLLTFDGHVAIPSTLLVGGIFGLGITINFFLGFIISSFKFDRLLYFTSVSILAYTSIHLFSYMQWNFNPKVVNSTSFFIFCSLWLYARFFIVNKKQFL